MHENEFKKNWYQLKGKVQQKWSKFTDEDVAKINGQYGLFMNMLQKKYSYTSEQAEKEMHHWLMSCQSKECSNKECSDKERHSDLNYHKKTGHEGKNTTHAYDPEKKDKEKKHNHKDSEDKKRKAG